MSCSRRYASNDWRFCIDLFEQAISYEPAAYGTWSGQRKPDYQFAAQPTLIGVSWCLTLTLACDSDSSESLSEVIQIPFFPRRKVHSGISQLLSYPSSTNIACSTCHRINHLNSHRRKLAQSTRKLSLWKVALGSITSLCEFLSRMPS